MGHKSFRLIVDLSAFYKDHRNVARIFIKREKIKTIEGVKQHISSLFNITDFVLIGSGHFLPDSEDVSVLNNEEIVVVIPNKPEITNVCSQEPPTLSESSVSKKKRKRHLESIPEEEVLKKIKKRNKTKNMITCADEEPDGILCERKDNHKEQVPEENKTDSVSIPESSIIPLSRTPCLDGIVRLSRHVDSPIVVSKYVPPQMITSKYLAQKKVNIVKIDIIKNDSQTPISENVVDLKVVDATPKKLGKSYDSSGNISSSEPTVDANLRKKKSLNLNQAEASNYTKIFLDQKDANTHLMINYNSDNSRSLALDSQLLPENLIDLNTRSEPMTNTEDVLQNVDPMPSSHASSPQVVDQPMNGPSESIANDTLKTAVTKSKFSFASVGPLIEQLRDSVDGSGQSADVNASLTPPAKRKRVRKRQKRAKKVENSDCELTAILPSDYTPQSMLSTRACPSVHLKFVSDEENVTELDSAKCNVGDSSVLSSTEKEQEVGVSETLVNGGSESSVIETNSISDETCRPNSDTPLIFGKENIEMAPSMGDKLRPKAGDVVAFKVLKIGNDFCPEISNYIVGRISTYSAENKTVSFKILSGLEELVPLPGKLSGDLTEDAPNPELQEFKWYRLLEPKLLYP